MNRMIEQRLPDIVTVDDKTPLTDVQN